MAEITQDIQVAFDELGCSSRRRRQDAAHKIAVAAQVDPDLVADNVADLVAALERPEAQTRWEVLNALTELAGKDAEAVESAFDGAEDSLFDDGSSTVRLAAFLFLCRFGSTSAARSDRAWPLLDEAIQCYHGDAEYHDMLVGLLGMAQGKISKETSAALAERIKFDSENGSGYIKSFSLEILQALK